MTAEKYFGDWMSVIDKKELTKVMSILGREYKLKKLCPSQPNVFRAFELCSLNNLKVVMLGYDPYPDKYEGQPRATGILFGNESIVQEKDLSPSLKVIKEAAINLEIPKNSCIFDNTLENWAKQGILMLNSALTVEMNKTGSHTMIWRPFIIALLKHLSECETGIIYVLFGRQAQTFKPYINKQFNDILEIEHPTYYARLNKRMPSELFTTISNMCKDKYGVPIKWYQEC